MSYPIRRYVTDYTGRSPNNFVSNERHTLGPKAGPYHPIAPRSGPYYNNPETLIIYADAKRLTPGVDYFGSNLIAEATALGDGEVCELILLRNQEEGTEISISYQNVGGLWQNHAQGLVDLYNAFMADNRPIDWYKIMNKPMAYPPAYHLHMLKDVVGWESLVVAIERLINVLNLRNVPAFEALVDWVMTKSVEFVTEEEIRNMAYVDTSVSMRRLLYAAKKLNFNTVRILPRNSERRPPQYFVLDLEFTNFEEGEVVFWDIIHGQTFPYMFKADKGSFRIVNKKALLVIQTTPQTNSRGIFEFVVRIRRNSLTGPVLALSQNLKLKHSDVQELDFGLLRYGLWSIPTTLRSPLVGPSAESHFLIPEDNFYREIANDN